MLADLGAEVIKIEAPAGDVTRFTAPRRNGMPSYYAQQNTGKRSVSIDLARPEGIELALGLSDLCDIVVENFRPGVMARLGLGYESMAARNDRLIYASISGFGATGTWLDRRAYASVVHAEAGLMKSQGDYGRDGVYSNDRHSHGDVYSALETASGILAALFQREHTGRGQWIDVSMAHTMLYVNEHLHDELYEGEIQPDWIRTFGNETFPIVTLATGDQAVITGHPASKGVFESYIAAIERPELATDARFETPEHRKEHLGVLVGYVRDYVLRFADIDEFDDHFASHGLAIGLIQSASDICDSDWARERDVIRDVDDRGGGTFRIPNAPWRFSDAPEVGLSGVPRFRGEDNREVLAELLGLDSETIDGLESSGVLSEHKPRG
jgi:CoA:oxalate CoA-transferase